MSTRDSEPKLKRDARSMPVPDSAPPSMYKLMQQVRHRRRNRTIAKGAVFGICVTACLAWVIAQQPREFDNDRAIQTQIANSDSAESAAISVANLPKGDNQPATMRLFARVHGESPVFEFDRETKQIQHVGWVRSRQRVPIDMRYVPRQQQATYEAVLYREALPLSL